MPIKVQKHKNFLHGCFRVLVIFIFISVSQAYSQNESAVCRGAYFLDLESSSTQKDIMYCFIDADDPDGFTIDFDFDGTSANLSNGGTSKTFTSLFIVVPSNTNLASGLQYLEYGGTEITSSGVTVTPDGNGVFQIETKTTETADTNCGAGFNEPCTTSGLLVKIAASWTGSSSEIAGFYNEKIDISIAGK